MNNTQKRSKIFISLPMRGLSDEDIYERRDLLYSYVSDAFDLIDTMWMEDPNPDPNNKLYYLGKSIGALGEADAALFAGDWAKAPGCVIERMICNFYNIPIIDEVAAEYYSKLHE